MLLIFAFIYSERYFFYTTGVTVCLETVSCSSQPASKSTFFFPIGQNNKFVVGHIVNSLLSIVHADVHVNIGTYIDIFLKNDRTILLFVIGCYIKLNALSSWNTDYSDEIILCKSVYWSRSCISSLYKYLHNDN